MLFCLATQSLASLTLPALGAGIIDFGVLRHDAAYALRAGTLILRKGHYWRLYQSQFETEPDRS